MTPWAPHKINASLKTLAGLQPGNKFQVDDNGTLLINTSFWGRKDRDSVSQPRARQMIYRLFEEAITLSKEAADYRARNLKGPRPDAFVSRGEIERALAGLRHLRQTYTSGTKQQDAEKVVRQ